MENPILYRIWRLRVESGYTQEYVANFLNMSRVMYCLLENGRTTLHVHHIIGLSYLYGVTSDYILCLSDSKVCLRKVIT